MADGKIFICYRREDSAGHSGRIYDRLNARFPGRVFMDVAGIGIGSRWQQVIERTLRACEVCVVLIGPRWLASGPDGVRRIGKPDDPLRAELTTALRLDRRIVPVLVGGVAMPDRKDLPADVAPVADWQALRVDDEDFDHDVSRLIRALEQELGDVPSPPSIQPDQERVAQVGALMRDAEAAMARSDWILAIQILNAVLSLDRHHGEAAERLRLAEDRARRTYRPPPQGRRLLPWAAAAVVAGVVIVGAVSLAFLAGMLSRPETPVNQRPLLSGSRGLTPSNSTPPGSGPAGPPPVAPTPSATGTGGTNRVASLPLLKDRGTEAATENVQEPAPRVPATPPDLSGTYRLYSYAVNGQHFAVGGMMHLTRTGPQSYSFQSMGVDQVNNIRYDYQGVLQWQGNSWTVIFTASNDPSVVPHAPVANQLAFDGATLTFHSALGQTAVWIRQ